MGQRVREPDHQRRPVSRQPLSGFEWRILAFRRGGRVQRTSLLVNRGLAVAKLPQREMAHILGAEWTGGPSSIPSSSLLRDRSDAMVVASKCKLSRSESLLCVEGRTGTRRGAIPASDGSGTSPSARQPDSEGA